MEIGLNQLTKPAPLWFRRCLNAIIIFVMPAFTGFVMGMPTDMMSTDAKNLCVSLGVFITAMLKAMEYMIGETPPVTNGNAAQSTTNAAATPIKVEAPK